MLGQAQAELEKARALAPSSLRTHLDWARICIRSGAERGVAKWIKEASVALEGEPEDLLELAQLLDRYNRRREALDIGYRTLIDNWGTSERLHMMFMSLFLLRQKTDSFLKVKNVGIDTAVVVRGSDGSVKHYVIEERERPVEGVLFTFSSVCSIVIWQVSQRHYRTRWDWPINYLDNR